MLKKTKKIKEQVQKKTLGFWAEFKKFISRGNIIDLATAVVIGGAFGKIVTSLVNSIITPLTALFLRSGDISGLKWVLVPAVAANEAEGVAAVPEVAVTYGAFLQSVLDFLIIALVIFVIVKIVMRVNKRIHAREIAAEQAKAEAEKEKKKAEEEAAALELKRKEDIMNRFYCDAAMQAKTLNEIKEILLKINKA